MNLINNRNQSNMNYSYLVVDYVLEEIITLVFDKINNIDQAVHNRTISWCQQLVNGLCSSSNNTYDYYGLAQQSLQQCPEAENKVGLFSIKIANPINPINPIKSTKTIRAKSQKRIKKIGQQIKTMKSIETQSLQPKKNILKLTEFMNERQRSENKNNSCAFISIKQNKQSDETDRLPVWMKKGRMQSKKSVYHDENKQKNNFNPVNLLYNVSQPKLTKNRDKVFSDSKLRGRSKAEKSRQQSQKGRPQLKSMNKSRKSKKQSKKQIKIMNNNNKVKPAHQNSHKLTIIKKKDRIQIVNRVRFRQYFPTFAKLYDHLKENLSDQ